MFQKTLWKSTCGSVPNTCEISIRALFSSFFSILSKVDFENVSPSVRWNLWCVCWHIACRCQVSSWTLRELVTPNSNAFIWKTKTFLSNFCLISGIYIKFRTFWKKMIMVIGNVFAKSQTVKNFVRPLWKKCRFGTRFVTQDDKVSQILPKSQWEHFYHVLSSFWEKLIWNISPVLLGEILGMFHNTLSAESKYPIEEWENLPFAIQMQLSEKRRIFSQFFVPFMDSASNFKHFEKERWSP